MKFQDPNMHGSNVTGGIKKCEPPTHRQAKSSMLLYAPPNFSKLGGIKINGKNVP